jgi:hypothetical protein
MMIFVLAMTSALAVSGAFVTRQMAATARSRENGDLLEPDAEEALTAAVTGWDSLSRAVQTVGSTASATIEERGDARVALWITRLTPTTYWLVAEASASTRPRLSRRLGIVVRLTNGVPILVSERPWAELP